MVEDKDYVDMCVVCKEAIPKSDLVYQKGRVFHSECFEKHGSSFPAPNEELVALSAKTRIELVQMKNLKARAEQGILQLNPSKKSSSKARTKKSKAKKRTKKTKTKKRKAKKKVIKRKKSKSKTKRTKAKKSKAKRAKQKRRPKSKAKRAKKRR